MKQNIVLVGMSGAGKSTIGVLLAKTLGFGFVDTDIQIQQREARTLQTIIDSDGIDAFLAIEQSVLCDFCENCCVVATGGSAVYSDAAMSKLKENGIVVYLSVPFKELQRRLTDVVSRGIVIKPGETLLDVFLEREPLYERYSDITVNCSDLSIENCVTKIAQELKNILNIQC